MSAPQAFPFTLNPWTITRINAVEYPIYDHNSDGTAVNLTTLGTTWLSQLKRSHDGAVVADLTVDQSNADGSAGPTVPQIVLSLTGVQTEVLSPRTNPNGEPDYYCDVLVTGGPLDPVTPYRIDVFIDLNVTSAA